MNPKSSALFVLLLAVSAPAADWLPDGGTVERTAWQMDEKVFTFSRLPPKLGSCRARRTFGHRQHGCRTPR